MFEVWCIIFIFTWWYYVQSCGRNKMKQNLNSERFLPSCPYSSFWRPAAPVGVHRMPKLVKLWTKWTGTGSFQANDVALPKSATNRDIIPNISAISILNGGLFLVKYVHRVRRLLWTKPFCSSRTWTNIIEPWIEIWCNNLYNLEQSTDISPDKVYRSTTQIQLNEIERGIGLR